MADRRLTVISKTGLGCVTVSKRHANASLYSHSVP
eukprot:SAG11_NODE_16978_length_532_cov_0.868360_1_plen_34_part_01